MGAEVRLEFDGVLAVLTLSHPGKLNSMSVPMWRSLRMAAEQLSARPDLRAAIVRGEAGQFCAGGDIAEYPGFRFHREGLRAFHEEVVWPALQALLRCELPLIAQIEGACMGAGLEIASCCDLRVAAQGARFGAPIAKLGFSMAPREAALVARAVGEMTAREMLLEAAVLSATEMHRRGFLHQCVPDADVAAEAAARARRVASLAPAAARRTKKLFFELFPLEPSAKWSSTAIEKIVSAAYDYADCAEHREGIEAFLAKRRPRF
ncbi:MAG: enoyl-CoA hydratase-related protein [Tibeticola sp.]